MALGKVPERRGQWLEQMIAYTLGGAASSALLGAVLGGAGALLLTRDHGLLPVAALVAVACLMREALAPELRIPQVRRQTSERWAKTYSPTTAAALWGLDIGLTITTWFTFSGAWLVLALAFLSTDAVQGAVILVAYWTGRALSVWAAPVLATSPLDVPETLDALNTSRGHARAMHALALVMCAVAVVVLSVA